MRGTSLLLLCLLWSLVEVHSQTAPYVSFMGETLPNHAYVNLSLVGNDGSGSDSVQCHTDLDTCCTMTQGPHRGVWNAPGSERRLPFSTDASADIYEARGAQRVYLRRRNNADMPSGIYHCHIATNAVHDDDDSSVRESVYVGLYASGGIYVLLLYIMSSKLINASCSELMIQFNGQCVYYYFYYCCCCHHPDIAYIILCLCKKLFSM